MTDGPTAVSVTDLEIGIPGGPVLLAKTSLGLRRGRITALTGPSGSGKSTLLRAVIGDLPDGARVSSGTVEVLGHDVLALPAERLRHLRRHRVAYVGQDPGSALDPRMRVRRLVAETAADPSPRAVRDLLAECRLPVGDGLPDRRPGALSGGQQRRVALARALARRPDLLLLDEPTAGLDTALRDEISDLLRRLAATRHIAVVLACHDPGLVDRCADDVVDLGTAAARRAARPGGSGRGAAADGTLGRSDASASVPGKAFAESFTGSSAEAPAEAATAPLNASPPRRDAPGALLAARDVTVTFTQHGRTHRALDGAGFSAAPGSSTGIIGPSGSGKTTLLRVLAGLQQPDTGALSFDGRPLPAGARRRSRAQQRRIQLIPQNPLGALNPARTVGATLARPLRLHRAAPKPEIADRVAGLLHDVGLPADFAGRYPHELSGGQRQRVSIARALAPGPDVLLCDEVTSALDPGTAAAVMDLLTRLRTERRLTLVVVSHELHLVAACTETVHVLEAGRITGTGPSRHLLRAGGAPPSAQ
ncbi:ABC transporter ATP-binding protein [Streptomyces rectiverticillatus]|uniref:ABC transporter ATP-binding protein n=1 Tax=Streptomyces rectiverticillatus TaxID=173860 RepID=UPI0015C3496D|nr:ATP-binding cassette domain-containing protein [Streptomyces rectiverticillatus]QLE74993.1 ABC transporter ATP-binding protein [Streptomyces rectiverticillatus]